jgi:hypothetical protein
LLCSKNVLFSQKLVSSKMKNYLLIIVLGLVAGFVSCEKYNQIDNNSTVKVPYILYVGGLDGYLASTNDGFNFNTKQGVFSGSDTTRGIIVADTNVIHIRQKLYVSSAKAAPLQKPVYVVPNDQNMSLLDVFNKRVYVAGRMTAASPDFIIYSSDNGQSWNPDANFASTNTVPSGVITSITQTKGGVLYCMNTKNQIFTRTGTGAWSYVTPTTLIDSLPGIVPGLTQEWFIGSYDNNVLAIDKKGNYGIYKSTNGGVSWKFMTGLPAAEILFVKQVEYSDVVYVGTKGAGLWRLEGNNFRRTDGGMLPNSHIYGITGKRITYRTDLSKYYYFAATNNGLYRSENNGIDWVKLSSHPLSEVW